MLHTSPFPSAVKALQFALFSRILRGIVTADAAYIHEFAAACKVQISEQCIALGEGFFDHIKEMFVGFAAAFIIFRIVSATVAEIGI
jgi:hypothetical protein